MRNYSMVAGFPDACRDAADHDEARNMDHRFSLRIVAATLVLASAATAQSPPASAPPATIPFVAKAFGYEIRVPAGWSYDRTGFFGPGDSVGTLRGAAPGGRETLQILIFREQKLTSFPEWIEFFSRQLGGLSGAKGVRVKGSEFSSRPAAYVVVDARIGLDRTRTTYFCVQFQPGTVWVFSHASVSAPSLNDAGDAPNTDVRIPAEFTRLTNTLRIFHDPAIARQMAEALRRGREFLSRYELQERIRALRTDNTLRYYEIQIAGKPIGFFTRQFSSENEPVRHTGQHANTKGGLRVRERSYRFAADGAVNYGKTDLFSSRDGETDLYEMLQATIPPPDAADADVWIARDQCVRESDTLFSTYVTNRERGLPTPRRPIKLDQTYLGLGWVRLLPALVGNEPRPALGFTIYDAETRTLVTYSIKQLGERPLPGRPGANALAFETRAGFSETPGMVYTDRFGNMLRYEAGDLTLQLSDEKTITEKFGKQRDDADRRYQAQPRKP